MVMAERLSYLARLECVLQRWLMALVALGTLLLAVGTVCAASDRYARTARQLEDAVAALREARRPSVAYDAFFRRDPMRAIIDERGELVSASALHGGLSVQGVIWSEQRPLAVVDDELVAVGDVLGPYTVLDIQSGGLMVQRDAQELFIPLDRSLLSP